VQCSQWPSVEGVRGKCQVRHLVSAMPRVIRRAHRTGILRGNLCGTVSCCFVWRSSWLLVGSRRHLQLDGYSDRLKLAFEHQGLQHDIHVEHFHRKPTAFDRQQGNDRAKKALCKEHGVTLVRIPQLNPAAPPSAVKQLIVAKLRENGVRVPRRAAQVEIDWTQSIESTTWTSIGNLSKVAGAACYRRRG